MKQRLMKESERASEQVVSSIADLSLNFAELGRCLLSFVKFLESASSAFCFISWLLPQLSLIGSPGVRV